MLSDIYAVHKNDLRNMKNEKWKLKYEIWSIKSDDGATLQGPCTLSCSEKFLQKFFFSLETHLFTR